ncbi:Rv3235 family protein [Zafaria sp. Z1313]|uniref:Rv3235 family protein n=1 Tax=unclassified Zafaria TaxID=2828765 RepID=UPI002E76F2DE|nr:Rv3235 family protein [Zafaria sp. J156]MEE1620309.1 Rv3235 family protein [Zafaria sp. J156]
MSSTPEPRKITARRLQAAPSSAPGGRHPRRFEDLLTRRPAASPLAGGSAAGGAPPRERARAAELERRAENRQIATIARLVGQVAFESLSGLRPVAQLSRWLEPAVMDKVRERAELCHAARAGSDALQRRGTAVTRTRICRVADGVYEASLVVTERQRFRAAALRIEQRRGQWRVSALELG